MDKLKDLIKELESYIPKQEMINSSVSASSVGWHIEHTLISVKLIIDGLKNSNPEDYKWKFNVSRIFVMTMGKIPRGKGVAPEITLPKNKFNESTLKENAESAIEELSELEFLKPNNFIQHPYFGDMNLKPSLKLLLMHTRHHVHIIKDIVESGN